MTDEIKTPSTQDPQMELSCARTSMALDQTLLAWVRTSLSLLAFGFTLAKFVHDLIIKGYLHGVAPEYPRQLGIGMMLLGILGLLGGVLDYVRSIKKLRSVYAISIWSTALVVTSILAVISMLLLVSLLTNLVSNQ